jgi:Xaa-Pro dipeptidase
VTRRLFLAAAAAGAASAQTGVPEAIRKLRPMTAGVKPITDDERRARMEKARRLMRENKIDALVMEPGSSAFYFTGAREYTATLPARGEPVWFLPPDQQRRAHEANRLGIDTRELSYKNMAAMLNGRLGIEERVRFAVYDGLRKAKPALEFTSGDPVTIPCRVIKSPAEIALMQPPMTSPSRRTRWR